MPLEAPVMRRTGSLMYGLERWPAHGVDGDPDVEGRVDVGERLEAAVLPDRRIGSGAIQDYARPRRVGDDSAAVNPRPGWTGRLGTVAGVRGVLDGRDMEHRHGGQAHGVALGLRDSSDRRVVGTPFGFRNGEIGIESNSVRGAADSTSDCVLARGAGDVVLLFQC